MASTARLLELDQVTPTPLLEIEQGLGGPIGANRRFTPRVFSPFIVRQCEGGPSYDGVDISFGGMMCTGGQPTWPGNTIDVELILPGEHKPLALSARVVELVTFRGRVAMRMRFDDISQAERKRIAMWMARRARV